MAKKAGGSKKTPKTKSVKQSNVERYFYLTLVMFCILIFYPPFFKGLFFEVPQQWTLFFASLIFIACILWQMAKNQMRFLDGAFSYLIFALPCIYILSAFNAADLRLAVAEIVKMILYFIVFWVAGQLTREPKSSVTILTVLYLSGVLVALAGFLSAVGVLTLKDSFVSGRIYSTMQYPNTLAIFLAAIMMFGFWLWLTDTSLRWRLFLAWGNFLMMFVFISTFSRGGLLVFAGMLLLYFVGMPAEYRLPWLGHLAAIIPLGAICAFTIVPAAYRHNYVAAWFGMLAGSAVVLLLHRGFPKIVSAEKFDLGRISAKKIAASLVIVFVLAAGGLILWGVTNDTQPVAGGQDQPWYFSVLPYHVASRLQDFNFESRNAQLRIYWSVEALKIVKEHPILGMGGGAWEAYNRTIQDYPFNSSQVHNHFMQLWAEAGTVGFLVFLGIWLFFVIVSWKNFRGAPDIRERLLDLTIFSAGIGIGVHSLMDFDLSLSAIAIVLWTCFGLAWGRSLALEEADPAKGLLKEGNRTVFIGASSLVALAAFVLSTSLLISFSYQADGVRYVQAGRLDQAESSFVNASRFDPFSSEIRANLASIKKAQKDKEAAMKYMEQALDRSPYDFSLYGKLADIYIGNGDVDKGIEAAKAGVKVAPWTVLAYQNLADVYVQGGMRLLQQNDIEGAARYLTECEEIPQTLRDQAETIPDRAKELWSARDKFYEFTPKTKMAFGVAQMYLEKFDLAEDNFLDAAKNETLKPEVYFWLAVLARKTGKEAQVQELLASADEAVRNSFDSVASLTAVPTGQ